MKLYKIILFCFLFFAIERFCHRQTEGFRLQKIASQLPYRSEWATPPASSEVKELLDQPYFFLGSGGQCYAFLSEDGQTVLKLFKHHHLRALPFGIQKKKRQQKLEELFSSFKIAQEKLQQETGLVYLHLNATDDLSKTLILVDPLGIRHPIDPDRTTFALQKKAEMALPTLQKLVDAQEWKAVQNHLSSLLDLIVSRSQKKVADWDPIIKRNMGFINGKAVEIDLGSFSLDPSLSSPINRRRAVFFETLKLRRWVKKKAPALLPFFELQLSNRFDIVSQELSEPLFR